MNRVMGSRTADLYSGRGHGACRCNSVLSSSHFRLILVLASLALVAPAAAQATRPTSDATRVCAHELTQTSRLDAACRTYRFAVSAARTSYAERIRRASATTASASAAKQTAEEGLGTQYEAEIAPAVQTLGNAYAAAATVLVNSIISVNATVCEGPVSAIPLLSTLLCSTYKDALGAAQAAFRSATAPANASYAKQWAAIQTRYDGVNRAVAADRRGAGRDLTVAMARAVGSFRRAAGV